MAVILGLSFHFHDSAASLVRDGQIVAAAAEERFNRHKHSSDFPKFSLEYCLEEAELSSVNQIDAIVFYEKPVIKFMRVLETLVQTWPRSMPLFTRRLPTYLTRKVNIYSTIEKHLPGYQNHILFAEHHASHAASAFYCSPFEEAAILTIDGVGEWETTTIGVGRGREIRLERAIQFPHSIGLLYSALTSYLGFSVNDGEWKVMGLAPYGKATYLDEFRQLVDMREDGSFHLNMRHFVYQYSSRWTAHHRRWQQLFGFPRRRPEEPIKQHHEDLACSGQAVVEEMILNLAREARRASGSQNLVIAGGVALNGVANWKIEREGIFDNVWIQPAAGDDGGSLGAALLVSQQLFNEPTVREMKHAYYGPEFSCSDVEDFLSLRRIPHVSLSDDKLVEETADLITSGKVVGWSRGRMEFGPRALGSRSILADPTRPNMKELINQKIKFREYFRPFAPSVVLESVHEYFDVPPGTQLPFMLKVPFVRTEKQSAIPAVTHEDGSGRVQTVSAETNPVYYRLIRAVEKRTGIPVVLNTSFNVRGEPIVCTPEDAYNCFVNTDIDALVVGNCLITEKPLTHSDLSSGRRSRDELELRLGEEIARSNPLFLPIATSSQEDKGDTGTRVLNFYKELPFNYYSNGVDMAVELMAGDRIREYPILRRHLRSHENLRVLDVGCGAGWFTNSCVHFYGHSVKGVDMNRRAIQKARSTARYIPGCEAIQYDVADLFEYEPGEIFDVVNSLGVLHHTRDCATAIRQTLKWVTPGGYLHLGLYHLYGRKPFLDHFQRMKAAGAEEESMYREFARLNPDIKDSAHLNSWYRDQVHHPHETQHTFGEICKLLGGEGFTIEATSLNRFRTPMPSATQMEETEKRCCEESEKALRAGRYYPGFFIVWARREGSLERSGNGDDEYENAG
jgi:carbamoyltransferase